VSGGEAAQARITLDDRENFDRMVKGSALIREPLQDYGDLEFATIDKGTEAGRALVAIGFTVAIPAGLSIGRIPVQTVTSVRLLKALLRAIDARYDDDGKVRA
jgi:hypothetical protein